MAANDNTNLVSAATVASILLVVLVGVADEYVTQMLAEVRQFKIVGIGLDVEWLHPKHRD